jgi:hypothetical protein
MSKAKITIIALVITLFASNAWWAYRLLDAGVTQTYMSVSLTDNSQALSQTLAILPVVARPDVSRSEVISAAKQASNDTDSFEKDGFIWVGKIGLRFNDNGQLVEAQKSWDGE